jgi:hypothetical protein
VADAGLLCDAFFIFIFFGGAGLWRSRVFFFLQSFMWLGWPIELRCIGRWGEVQVFLAAIQIGT